MSGQAGSGPRYQEFAPTPVIYQRDDDVLRARIEGEVDGHARSMEWNFTAQPLNARCPT